MKRVFLFWSIVVIGFGIASISAAQIIKAVEGATDVVSVEMSGWPPGVDALNLAATELAVQTNSYRLSQLSISIENRSGIGMGIAIKENAFTAGPCTSAPQGRGLYGDYRSSVSGLKTISEGGIQELASVQNPISKLLWFPPGHRIQSPFAVALRRLPYFLAQER